LVDREDEVYHLAVAGQIPARYVSAVVEAEARRPDADLAAEAEALLRTGNEQGVHLCALGGIAVQLCSPSAARPPLARPYRDIDVVGLSRDRDRIETFLSESGYEAGTQFNLLNGQDRLLFWDMTNGRQLDVFLDRVVMCQTDYTSDGKAVLYSVEIHLADGLELTVVRTGPHN
jgi:hypothetical protein